MARPGQRGQSKLIVIGAIALIGAAAAWSFWPAGPKPAPKVAAVDKGEVKDRQMTDAERAAYVAASVTVTDLAIGPDMKPDRDEVVPGLMRVTGKVHNGGDRRVHKVNVVVHLKDGDDAVLGTYVDNVVAKRPLGPGESGDFKFLVPEKKAFSGRFDHQIR